MPHVQPTSSPFLLPVEVQRTDLCATLYLKHCTSFTSSQTSVELIPFQKERCWYGDITKGKVLLPELFDKRINQDLLK
jgi:hypothetical protein